MPLKKSFYKFLHYLKPFRWRLLAILILISLGSIGTLISPMIIKVIIDEVFPSGNYQLLIKILGSLVLINVLRIGIEILTDYLYNWTSGRIILNIRSDLFYHVSRLPMIFFQENRRGDIIKRVTDEVDEIESIVTSSAIGIIYNGLTIVGISAALCWLNLELFIISVVVIPLIYLNIRYFQPKIKSLSYSLRDKESAFSAFLVERIENVNLIKSFNRQKYEQSNLINQSKEIIDDRVRRTIFSSGHRGISTFIISLTPVIIFGWGGGKVISGVLTVGTLIAFLQYLNRLFVPFREVMRLYIELLQAAPAMKRVFEYFDYACIEPALQAENITDKLTFKNVIRLKNVDFSYGDHKILKKINVEIKKGEKYVFVGQSGSGKSTLLKLICGFYQLDSGSIQIDGVEIKEHNPYDLRNMIGYIGQHDMLFNDTISNNIAYGNLMASNDEIIKSAQTTGVFEDILLTEQGFDAKIGDQGSKLSGGQKQLISFSRLMLKDSEIIIIDESTSAIDPTREHILLSNLFEAYKDKTIIAVTHRLSTTRYFDHVICMEGGEIVDSGTYAELAGQRSFFNGLFNNQPA